MPFRFSDHRSPADSGATPPGKEIWLNELLVDQWERAKSLGALELDDRHLSCDPSLTIVIQSQPTLDDMLAAELIQRRAGGQTMDAGMRHFAEYARTARQGLATGQVPVERSLEGIYLAVRHSAAEDLQDAQNAENFCGAWNKLARRIFLAAEQGLDPHVDSILDIADDQVGASEFSLEQAFLREDRAVYRLDVARGEQWLVAIPGGPPQASALYLVKPRSMLFGKWCRVDEDAPTGDGFALLVTQWGTGNWVVSTARSSRISLKPLADQLSQLEFAQRGGDRAQAQWFDGASFEHTMIAAPKDESQLRKDKVIQCIKRWCGARSAARRRWNLPAAAAVGVAVMALIILLVWRPWAGKPERGWELPLESLGQLGVYPSRDNPRHIGRLWVISCGISTYQAAESGATRSDREGIFNLDVAHLDAEKIASDFAQPNAGEAERATVRKLINEQATGDEILDTMEDVMNQAQPGDLVIITMSGHGKKDRFDQYVFLPYDFDPDRAEDRTGITWGDIALRIKSMPCPVLLLVDTCHSGEATRFTWRGLTGIDAEEVVNSLFAIDQKVNSGLIILASSKGHQRSMENDKWGHGALTLAFREALRRERLYKAQSNTPLPEGRGAGGGVTLQEIRNYVEQRVREITGDRQSVVSNHTGGLSLDEITLFVRRDAAAEPKSTGEN